MGGLYYPSWSDKWASDATNSPLSQLPLKYTNLTHVFLSFSNPTLTYTKNQNSFKGTGLEFSSDFQVIKAAIQILKTQKIKVFLSVGGGAYWSSDQEFNIDATVALATDLGVDGIDIDYESQGDGKKLTAHIKNLRAKYQGKIFFAGWSTGAYPSDKSYAGSAIDALINCKSIIDGVNIMAYDAGALYSPQEAFNSYRQYYKGPLFLGFLVGTPGWGNYLLKESDVVRDFAFLAKQPNSGFFVWCEGKTGIPSVASILNRPLTTPPPGLPLLQIQCPVCKTVFKK
jgi:chitinase